MSKATQKDPMQALAAAMRAESEFVLDGDDIAPRTKQERYRLYRVKDGGAPELVATCRTESAVGTTLCRLGREGEFLDYCVGVMDGRHRKDVKGNWIGKWLILPWQEKGGHDEGEGDQGAA